MRKLLHYQLAVLWAGSLCAQSPTLTTFLASQVNLRTAISTRIGSKPTPRPLISVQYWPLTDIYCGYAQQASNACKFSLSQAENALTALCPSGLPPLADIIEVNVDYWNWVANTTQAAAHRTFFDALLNPSTGFIVTACPSMKVVINPGFISGNLNSVCASLAGTPNPMGSPVDLNTCLTTTATWLTISATNYSPVGYLAKQYGSELLRFSAMHEPVSANNNYTTFNASWSGTPAQWATFIAAQSTAIHAQCVGCQVSFAVSRLEYNWFGPMIAAAGIQAVGFDDYTSDLSNVNTGSSGGTAGGLGTLVGLAAVATTNGIPFYISEEGMDAWVPTGAFSGYNNSYQNVGNCVWMQNDYLRQNTVNKFLLWSAQGATDISNFNELVMLTACVIAPPSNSIDNPTSGTFPTTFATAAGVPQNTNLTSFFTALYAWPFYNQSGGPFGI